MSMKAELAKSQGNGLDGPLTVVTMRLKKLRHERNLVERAIVALTQIARTRESRDKRAPRR
jgi:hypothetical protein